jgi:hypothetical protein
MMPWVFVGTTLRGPTLRRIDVTVKTLRSNRISGVRAIVAWAAVAVVAVACSRPLVTAPERSGTTNASARTAAGLEKCGRPPVAIPRLESYWDVTLGAKYWVDMVWRDDEWQPGGLI